MKKDIAQALGIPYALLFSEAASYATLEGDRLGYYENTVEPRCEFIAAGSERRPAYPARLQLEFQPETPGHLPGGRRAAQREPDAARQRGRSAVDGNGYTRLRTDRRAASRTGSRKKEKEEKAEELAKRLAGAPKEEEKQKPPPAQSSARGHGEVAQ